MMQHSACMIEAFKRDGPVYHVVKKCRNDCPVLINSTAQHIRCCFKDACNDLITIGMTMTDVPLPDVASLLATCTNLTNSENEGHNFQSTMIRMCL